MAMDDENHPPRWTTNLWIVVVALAIGAMAYVLSTGPAVMLRERGMITQDTFLRIYAPLAPFSNMLEWYLRLWI